MLRFEWNALQLGDAVAVHNPSSVDTGLLTGTVVMVEPKRSKHGVNGIGIRVETAGGHQIVWPSHLTAHHDPPDPRDRCWRCAALAGQCPL